MTLGTDSLTLRNGLFLHRRRFLILATALWPTSPQLCFGFKRMCIGTELFSRNRLKSSWTAFPVTTRDDVFNGWLSESPSKKAKGYLKHLFASAFAGAVLAAVAYFFYIRGFRLSIQKPYFKQFSSAESIKHEAPSKQEEETAEPLDLEITSPEISQNSEPLKASIPVDSLQLEAFSLLKKLNIVDDDAKEDELCTRREYCRWLIKLNSFLERNPKHKVLSAVSLSGSFLTAFDDVALSDPDFNVIQCLAEAGLIRSKLSSNESCSFYPDRFVARNDVVQWKIPLEYGFTGYPMSEMSTMKFEFMDMKETDEDAFPEFLMDLRAGDTSIFKQVFGQSKRIQPNKPLSKAQAAVALLSGRNKEAVKLFFVNKEAEDASKMAMMEEIRGDLEERGDIERMWCEKMEEERRSRRQKEELYEKKMSELEGERLIQDESLIEAAKEREAMHCQKNLCENVRSEIEMIPKRVVEERTGYVTEVRDLERLGRKLGIEKRNLEDAKLGLQSELEAIQMFRRRVEEEAARNEDRVRVLGEVSRRWSWVDKTG